MSVQSDFDELRKLTNQWNEGDADPQRDAYDNEPKAGRVGMHLLPAIAIVLSIVALTAVAFALGVKFSGSPSAPAAAQTEDLEESKRRLAVGLAEINARNGAPFVGAAEQKQSAQEEPKPVARVELKVEAPAVVAAAPALTPSVAPAPVAVAPAVDAAEAARLMARAKKLISEGQVASARALLERALRSNQPEAAFALAETFDARQLKAWKALGIAPDAARAEALYRQAADAGLAAARARLTR
jgi:TPR repeat protein